jgi:uncharacterized membrane protein YhaH (DUF805 family)
MNCSTCGNSIEDGAQFCGGCGSLIDMQGAGAVGLIEAIRLGFQNYSNFSGRASRSEYWWWTFFVVVVAFALNVLGAIVGPFGIVASLFGLGTLLPNLAVGARRLHDIDKSGWYLLLWLLPVIGWVWLLILDLQRGTHGPNGHD